ncbi:MAG: hypothetical protein RLZZ282_799 [Verrucomicrobiota bacterium]|jgi:hypothetical protein
MFVFRPWQHADSASNASACAIILHGQDAGTCAELIDEIANYLNEYDDDGDGRWLPANQKLIEKMARESHPYRLLSHADVGDPDRVDLEAGYRKTLTGLIQRGHVILRSPVGAHEPLGLSTTFHVGVGCARMIPEKCHLILDPDLMDQKCMAHIIGDVFLEWHHCEMRRGSSIHEIKKTAREA